MDWFGVSYITVLMIFRLYLYVPMETKYMTNLIWQYSVKTSSKIKMDNDTWWHYNGGGFRHFLQHWFNIPYKYSPMSFFGPHGCRVICKDDRQIKVNKIWYTVKTEMMNIMYINMRVYNRNSHRPRQQSECKNMTISISTLKQLCFFFKTYFYFIMIFTMN